MDQCKVILMAVVILVSVCASWLYVNHKEQNTSINSDKIEVLKAQNDSLFTQNKSLDATIGLLVIQADSLKRLVEIKKMVITDLKKVKYEKIKAIDDYSNDKLFRFFAGINTDSTGIGW